MLNIKKTVTIKPAVDVTPKFWHCKRWRASAGSVSPAGDTRNESRDSELFSEIDTYPLAPRYTRG